jgi:drug/metabolite transporter (DMT)-like permease
LAALLLGERISAWHMVGGVMVLAGVYAVHRSRQKKREQEARG